MKITAFKWLNYKKYKGRGRPRTEDYRYFKSKEKLNDYIYKDVAKIIGCPIDMPPYPVTLEDILSCFTVIGENLK